MATKKVAAKTKATRKTVKREADEQTPSSMPKEGRDPKGGLTAKGREFFNKKEGSHLRPGVVGPADTPEKMVRKGSFLRRHFTHPRGPMKNDKGEPTRLALSAHAWGEPVPNTLRDAKALADKGHVLLEHYHEIKDEKKPAAKGAGRPSQARAGAKTPASKPAAKGALARKTATKTSPAGKTVAKKTTAKKATAKQTTAGKGAGRSSSARTKATVTKGAARQTTAKKSSRRP